MRTLGLLLLLCLITLSSNAQKFGYIDSDYILKKLPEYSKAEKELNMLSSKWQAEIEKMKKE